MNRFDRSRNPQRLVFVLTEMRYEWHITEDKSSVSKQTQSPSGFIQTHRVSLAHGRAHSRERPGRLYRDRQFIAGRAHHNKTAFCASLPEARISPPHSLVLGLKIP